VRATVSSYRVIHGSDRAGSPNTGDVMPGEMIPGCSGGMLVNENSLSRIPFRVRDEMTILSMARWMRFIGAIKVVGGLVTVFVLLVGIIYIGAVLNAAPAPASGSSTITVTVGDRTEHVPLDKLRRLISENQVTFYALGVFALIVAVVGTALGFVLYQAADDFDRVARTDVADQDYITAGVRQLKTYLKVSVLLGVAAALVAVTAGIGLVARLSTGS
jgi:hypothetical protein